MQRFLRLEPGGDAGAGAAIQRLQGEQHRHVGIALDDHPRGGGKAPGLIGGGQLVGEALGIVALEEGEAGESGERRQPDAAGDQQAGAPAGPQPKPLFVAAAVLFGGLLLASPVDAGDRGWPVRRDPATGR